MAKPCFVFDIDGTLADCSHRLHFIQGPVKDWDGFFEACALDAPIPHTLDLMRLLMEGVAVICVSGRSDTVRQKTLQWLENYLPWEVGALYMRKAGDHRPDDVVKKGLLTQLRADGWAPIMVFDDRDRVVKMWRDEGVPCAQVAEGDF